MSIEKSSSDLKKGNQKTYFKIIIAGLLGAILGIVAYTHNWLG